jgi:hypothetical protein
MRQAILTKYIGPTSTKGARVKAWAAKGLAPVTVSWDSALGVEDNHAWAAFQLRKRHGWGGPQNRWQGGALPDGTGYCFVQIDS